MSKSWGALHYHLAARILVINFAHPTVPPLKNAAIIALLSIAFYFAVALPLHDRAKLQLEREKFQQEQKVRQEKEQAESERQDQAQKAREQAETDLLSCKADAKRKYNEDLELNGKPVPGKKGTFTGSSALFAQLKKDQREEEAACQRKYESDLRAAEKK